MDASLVYPSLEVGWAGWIWVTTEYKPYHFDMNKAKNTFRMDKISILYIYKVFKHLLMQWMAIWMHPYSIQAMEVGWAGWIRVTTDYKPYHYDMGEAEKTFRLDNTSILYI